MLISWCLQPDNQTDPSLNKIKSIDPQSNVGVNSSVCGNLYEEKNTAVICGEVSVILSVLPTLHHIKKDSVRP